MISSSSFDLSRFYPPIPPAPFVLLCLMAMTVIFGFLSTTLFAVSLVLTCWAIRAYMDPPRAVPDIAGSVIAPMDSAFTALTRELGLPLSFDQAKDQAEHFMRLDFTPTLCGGRVFRAPVTGTIQEILRFTPDTQDQKSTTFPNMWSQMDGVAILFAGHDGTETALVLDAPLIPRQIHLAVKQGDIVNAGDRLGVILVTARANLYLKEGSALLKPTGHHVRAGETILMHPSVHAAPTHRIV